jgi:hypothetical protein
MPNPRTLAALRAKRAELAAELRRLEQRAVQLRGDIDAFDHTIRLLEQPRMVTVDKPDAAGARLGKKGGEARARKLTAERRSEIARIAAATRWGAKT